MWLPEQRLCPGHAMHSCFTPSPTIEEASINQRCYASMVAAEQHSQSEDVCA